MEKETEKEKMLKTRLHMASKYLLENAETYLPDITVRTHAHTHPFIYMYPN